MTEQEWNEAASPQAIVPLVAGHSVRKRRLWAIACLRRLLPHWNGLGNFYSEALGVGEAYADDPSRQPELLALGRRVTAERREIASWHHDEFPFHFSCICEGLSLALQPKILSMNKFAVAISDATHSIHDRADWAHEDRAYVDLAHCVFGEPHRPVAFDPRWRTEAAVSLASVFYAQRDAACLPILADALEEASCDMAALLLHLRGPGPHARGCWPVDLVLGKG